MGRAITMENQIDTLSAKMEKRVKLLELQVKTIENNEKATKVIPIADSGKMSKAEQKDLEDRGLITPKKGAKKNATNK